jgi:hypothetical protein
MQPFTHVTSNELLLLRFAPYEHPKTIGGAREIKRARELINRGLLESDPSALGALHVRCTEEGMEVAKPLTRTRARFCVHAIRIAAEEGRLDHAAELERTLHHRVLVEIGTGELGIEESVELARIVATTTAIEFRR